MQCTRYSLLAKNSIAKTVSVTVKIKMTTPHRYSGVQSILPNNVPTPPLIAAHQGSTGKQINGEASSSLTSLFSTNFP